MKGKGQLSLEYLILLAAALSAFALLLPLLNQTYETGLFALDCANAKSFANCLHQSSEELSMQADGSIKTLEASPVGEWVFSSMGKHLLLEVQGPSHSTKTFQIPFPKQEPAVNFSISQKTRISLSNKGGKVLLEYHQP